jgi:hypothetical protein
MPLVFSLEKRRLYTVHTLRHIGKPSLATAVYWFRSVLELGK